MDTDASIEWKAQQADAWLRDARNMWKECARLQAMARDAREMADGLRAVRYDTIGGGSGMAHGDDAIAARLVRLESIEQRYTDALIDACDFRSEAWECIDKVQDATSRLLLQSYYIDCETWERSADRVGYSYRYAFGTLRPRALASVWEFMPARYREPLEPAI